MSLLRRSPEMRANIENPQVPLTSSTLLNWLTGPKVAAGVTVNEKRALGIMAVWRAVALISGSIASLPLHAYRIQDDIRVPAGERSQAERLLRKPHPDMTPFEFWELALCHLLLWGNFYARILREPGSRISELWPLYPGDVKAGRAKDGSKWYRVIGDTDPDGGPTPHNDRTIFHIPGLGYDGICGVSPIRAAREGLGLNLAAEQFGARLFGNGSLASGILQTEQRLTQEAADALKDRWAQKAGGLANAHEAVVLDRGAKFQQLTIPPEDAQFLETRRFQVTEVARLFGVPPHMLMDTERSTSWGSGIEHQSIGFVVYTLRPWFTRLEQRISQKLLPTDTVYARFSAEGLLRGDSKARAEFYRTMREIGAYCADDVRAKEEEPPIPDGAGQIFHQPANWVPLGTAPAEEQPAPAPAEEPDDDEEPAEEPADQNEGANA